MYVRKGSRIVARWFTAKLSSLAGMQTKTGLAEVCVAGVCRHIRADDPHNPDTIRLYIQADDGCSVQGVKLDCSCTDHGLLVEISPDWVVSVQD